MVPYFCNFEELETAIKKAKNSEEIKKIWYSTEQRKCPIEWVQYACKKFHQKINEEYFKKKQKEK